MRKKRHFIFWCAAAVVLLAAVVYSLQPYRFRMVWGDSMHPTLRSGTLIRVDTAYYRHNPIRAGDVVLLRHDRESLVKRVVAVPGDELLLIRAGDASAVLIPLWRVIPALELCRNSPETRLERLILEEGTYYVIGDNRLASFDSRDFGPTSRSNIIGKVKIPDLD